MWILKTVTEGHPEKTFRILPGNERTIGRATGADFIVDAALVSRVHCRVTALAGGELEIRDLESTNGTYVNGQRSWWRCARLSKSNDYRFLAAKYSSTNSLVVLSRCIVVSAPCPG